MLFAVCRPASRVAISPPRSVAVWVWFACPPWPRAVPSAFLDAPLRAEPRGPRGAPGGRDTSRGSGAGLEPAASALVLAVHGGGGAPLALPGRALRASVTARGNHLIALVIRASRTVPGSRPAAGVVLRSGPWICSPLAVRRGPLRPCTLLLLVAVVSPK